MVCGALLMALSASGMVLVLHSGTSSVLHIARVAVLLPSRLHWMLWQRLGALLVTSIRHGKRQLCLRMQQNKRRGADAVQAENPGR
jgi:hypothetical protein